MIEDDQPVADVLELAEQVRRHDHRAAAVGDRADQRAHVLHADGVEAVGRLVEDDELGVADQRGGDAETLLHPERVRADAVAAATGEPDEIDEVVGSAVE